MEQVPEFGPNGAVIGQAPAPARKAPRIVTLAAPRQVALAWLISGPLTPLALIPVILAWMFNPASFPGLAGLGAGLFFFTIPSTIGVTAALYELRGSPFLHSDVHGTIMAWAFRMVPAYLLLLAATFAVFNPEAAMAAAFFIALVGLIFGWPFAIMCGIWAGLVWERYAVTADSDETPPA